MTPLSAKSVRIRPHFGIGSSVITAFEQDLHRKNQLERPSYLKDLCQNAGNQLLDRMNTRTILLSCTITPLLVSGQALDPLAIPPALDMDTFQLVVGEHQHQFYPGITTTTFGVNGPYLGPTLIMHQGDTARFRVTNQLPQLTNMHWHGMHVPGVMDGGPPREILTGEYWDVKYEVVNPAGTWVQAFPSPTSSSLLYRASLAVEQLI